MNPLYDLTETGQVAVAIIGTITLLIGAIIGCAYDDIKKVLAYSTVSQIGYMFLAVGLGPYGYALGIAHLLAHGFFKAGLFLGAGSVMHAMNDNVDMRHYGGLWPRHADHVRHVRAGLPRPDRLPAVVGLLHQGRHHRGGVRRARLAGLDVRAARHDRRRAHRVLHDPAHVHDVLRREALEEPDVRGRKGLPPARVAQRHDGADGAAGVRLGLRGLLPHPGPSARQLAYTVAGRAARARGPVACGSDLHARARRLGDRGARRVARGRAAAGTGGASAARLVARTGRAARPVRQRDQ